MAKRKAWSIANYNAYLKAAKKSFGLTHQQAQRMYRGQRDRAGHALKPKDLKEHPRVAKQEAQRAARARPRGKRAEKPAKAPRARKLQQTAAETPVVSGAGAGAAAELPVAEREKYPPEFDEIEDFISDEYEGDEEDEY